MTADGCSSADGVADAARQVLREVKIHASSDKSKKCPRRTAPKNPCMLTCEFALDDFGGVW
jgi:hypothetical protein